jgi:hypothetical protein
MLLDYAILTFTTRRKKVATPSISFVHDVNRKKITRQSESRSIARATMDGTLFTTFASRKRT